MSTFSLTSEDEIRFWAKVDKTEACWLWTAASSQAGYGHFSLNYKNVRAHRLSYFLAFGNIPDGMLVRHKCDTPSCVRPTHLELGTDKQNAEDKVSRGRHDNGRLAKSSCKQGHEYTEVNTYAGRGHRECRTCKRDSMRRKRQK